MAGYARAAASLFRPNPPVRVTPLLVALTIAFAALVGLARFLGRGGGGVLDASEDVIALDDASGRPISESLLSPFSDTSHLLSRLLAEFAVHAPESWVTGVFVIGGALITAGLVLVVFTASAGLLPRTLQRLLVSVPLLVMPLAQAGPLGVTPIVRWQLLYAAFWAILWVPPSRAGRIVAPVVIGLAACSVGIGWVLLPLMAFRLTARRDASSLASAALLVAGSAWQLVLAANAAPVATPGLDQPGTSIIDEIGAAPARWVTEPVPIAVALITAVIVVVLAAMRVTNPRWSLAAVSAVSAVGICIAVSSAAAVGPVFEVPVSMLVVAALVALTNPTGDLRLPMGAGIREVGPWLPVTGLALLLTAAWAVDLAAHPAVARTVIPDAAARQGPVS